LRIKEQETHLILHENDDEDDDDDDNGTDGAVARKGKRRDVYRVLVGKLWERGHLEDLGVERRPTLYWILKNCDGGHGLD
jgi:hypothetical protein